MGGRLNDLGFRIEDDEQLSSLIGSATAEGAPVPSRTGTYFRWAPGAGVELWFRLGPGGRVCSCTPHFAGSSSLRVRVAEVAGRVGELGGTLYAWTALGAHGDIFEGPPLVLELPDLDLVRERLHANATISVQVTAFANAAECFADETAFRQWQEGRPQPMAPEFFIPSGAFAQPARAEAALAGHIELAEQRVNPATRDTFHHLRVRTPIGAIDVVAAPDSMDGVPVVGGVLQGYFWLSGRITAFG
jgi:hypothetical protein